MRLSLSMSVLLTLGVACNRTAEAGPDGVQDRDAELSLVTMYVAQALGSYHYSHRPIDDEISSRWLDKYVESLDYNRLYFLASDVAEFESYRTTLDDTLTDGQPDLSPATTMHARYVQRLDERLTYVDTVLAAPIDLTTDDTVQLDREDAAWATTSAELDDLWSRRVREEVLRLELGDKTAEEAIDIVKKRYARYRRDVDTEPEIDVVERYLSALTASFDPHSAWFAPATHDNFDIEMSDSVEGIGAELQTDGDFTKVVRTIPGGPAETSGEVQAGDRIIAVAQGDEEPVDIVGERIDDVVHLIRGPKDSTVRLTLWPADASDPGNTRVISIVRDKVKLERAAATVEMHTLPSPEEDLQIAVIDVPAFYVDWSVPPDHPDFRSASKDVKQLLADLPAGTDAVVVDLRENGGGSLDEAIKLTGLFIDRGPVVQTRDAQETVEVLEDDDPGMSWAGPLTVLTSVYSASASEIFAAAIQDYHRGLVVGASTTHGKGTVQNVFDLGRALSRSRLIPREEAQAVGGALKYTTQKFYRVDGGSTQHRGVYPDVAMPSPADGLDVREADLDYALPYDEIAPADLTAHYSLGVDPAVLRAASEARVTQGLAFAYMAEDRAERAEREHRPLSLNLVARRAELEAAKAKTKTRLAALGLTPCPDVPEGEEVPEAEACEEPTSDPVLDEALAITSDWLGVLANPSTAATRAIPDEETDASGRRHRRHR